MGTKERIFSGLPTWAKGIIAVGITSAVAFAGWKIYKFAKKRSEEADSRKETGDASNELSKLNKEKNSAQTLSGSEADAIANNLFTAMDGCGTDTAAIERNIAKLNNKADWLAVKKSYGVRTVTCYIAPNFSGTLEAALTSELSPTLNAGTIKNLQKKFASMGIKAGF